MHLISRGARFTVADILRITLTVAIFMTLSVRTDLDSAAVWFFALFIAVKLLLPMVLNSHYAEQKSNLDSPLENSLKWLVTVRWGADLIILVGTVTVLSTTKHSWIFLSTLAFAYLAYSTVIVFRCIRAHRAYGAWLEEFLNQYNAQFVLHTPRPDGGPYQIQMWIDPLERLDRNYIIIVRDARALDALRTLTARPIIVCRFWRDLDRVMAKNIRAVFYVNSVGKNADLLTYTDAKHVYLGHGDSEKPLSIHPLHAAFDFIAVAGQAAIDRYHGAGIFISTEKFINIGRPQIFPSKVDIVEKYRDSRRPTIIYAPTWQGYNAASSYSSLAIGPALVKLAAACGYRIVFRPHPLSRQRKNERKLCTQIEDVLRAEKSDHLYGREIEEMPFTKMMGIGDALIADRSSVIVEFLTTRRPIAEMELPPHAFKAPATAHRTYTYTVRRSLDNLQTVLETMLGDDPLHSVREEAANYYVDPSTADEDQFRRNLNFLFA